MKKFLKNRNGMTLVEGMVGMLLVAIFALVLFSGLLTAQKVMSRGDAIERQGQENAGEIAAGSVTATVPGSVRLTLNGTEIVFYGNYNSKEDPENPAADLTEFIVTPVPQTAP